MPRATFDWERLEAIEQLYLFCGGNGRIVADEFGISRERVRQILNRSTNSEVMRLHWSKLRKNSLTKKCHECQRKFNNKTVSYTRLGLCKTCKGFRKNHDVRTYTRHRPLLVKRYKVCADCNEPFTKENPHRSLMRHQRCYQRYLYHTSPNRRKYINKLSYQWHKRRMASDPEYRAKKQQYWKDYYQRPEVKFRLRIYQNRRYHEKRDQVKNALLHTSPS